MWKSLVAAKVFVAVMAILPIKSHLQAQPQTTSQLAQEPVAQVCVAPQDAFSSSQLTDSANLMAGFPISADSTLKGLSELASVKAHAANFSAAWKKLDARQLDQVKNFALTELSQTKGALFYPFSGPDFLYAHALFPNASSYLLTGLEPVGAVPNLAQMKETELNASLADLRKSLYAILSFSFFKTNDMRVDFRKNRFQGVVPVLMTFIAKSGMTIQSTRFFVARPDGTQCTTDAARLGNLSAGSIAGVEFSLRPKDAPNSVSLIYLSSDIGDEGIAKTPQYAALVRALKPSATFLKSASFLMHKSYFSTIRDLILEVSPIVLQDDSGIPYRHFDPLRWQANLYGTYVKPIPLFANHNQPDLHAAFKTIGSKPLEFGIGYRYLKKDSSLLLMRKSAAR
jgi:hypothetical protein